MKYELRALSFGETLGTAFNMYIDNFVVLFLLCMIVNIPSIFLNMNSPVDTIVTAESLVSWSISYVIYLVVVIILSAIETGLIVNYIAHRYLGKETNIKEFLNKTKSCFLPLIGLSLLASFCIGIGFMLLIIPGVIISLGLILSTQVLVIEKKGIIESMLRSWDLTKGKRLRILGFILIILALNFSLGIVLGLFIAVFGLASARWMTTILAFFMSSLVSPFSACVIVLIYFNSRIEKEGFAIEHLADQFLPDEEAAGIEQ